MPVAKASRRRNLRWFVGLLAGVLVLLLVVISVNHAASRGADSDGDGLPDRLEQAGWRTLGGPIHVTDAHQADTDGDGLTDGEEAGDVVSGDGENVVYAGTSDPTKIDSDDDGLDDKTEILGWSTEGGAVYRTFPTRQDTDGDGLTDSQEAGEIVPNAGDNPVHASISDPTKSDSDGDGLDDATEADLGLDAYDTDSDDDGIDDYREAVHLGTAADVADTDGDGLDDGYELENQQSLGFDPLSPDVKMESKAYAWEFAKGAVVGEIAPGDSLAWLAGNLAAGSTSFIPGVGWVVGGVADLRDAVGSAIRSDWVGTGFSIAGLVPAVGDVAAVPAKVTKFVARHPELAGAAGASILALKWVPDDVKVTTIARTTSKWDKLRSAGFSESALLRLQRGRVGLDALAEAMEGDYHRTGGLGRFFDTGKDGEDHLARVYGATGKQVMFRTKDCIEVCNPVARRIDVLVGGVAHESKVGRADLTPSIERQIRSDAYLIEIGSFEAAHWHFYASSVSNSIGPSKPVRDLLDAYHIPYTIHPPR